MVLLAITPKGLQDALQIREKTGDTIWCGADAMPEAEYFANPQSVSRFEYILATANAELMDHVIYTIAEHHPGQSIWVEAIPVAA
jgi:hypothetical protein